jgi:hypothetical protein
MIRSILWRQLLLGPTLWAIVLLVTLSPANSRAEDLAKFCTEAQSLLKQNQQIQALDVMQKGEEEVWNHIAFQAVKNVFVKEKSVDNRYEVRSNNVYKSGEIIRLYVEPVGFTQKKVQDHYLVELEADYTIAKEDGTVVAGKEHFWRYEKKIGYFLARWAFDLDFTIKAEPGNYVIKTVFRDLLSSKTLTVNTPVRFE